MRYELNCNKNGTREKRRHTELGADEDDGRRGRVVVNFRNPLCFDVLKRRRLRGSYSASHRARMQTRRQPRTETSEKQTRKTSVCG